MRQRRRPVLQRANPHVLAARPADKVAASRGDSEKYQISAADAKGGSRPHRQQAQFERSGTSRKRHRRRREARRRRSRPAARPQPQLFRPSDELRRRNAEHAHRARGGFRTGAVDHALRHGRRGESSAPTTPSTALPPISSPRTSTRRSRSRGGCAPATSTSTVRSRTPACRSAATEQSGNGRGYARYGLDDFLEIKDVAGYEAAEAPLMAWHRSGCTPTPAFRSTAHAP